MDASDETTTCLDQDGATWPMIAAEAQARSLFSADCDGKPDAKRVHKLAALACSYRLPARKAYAKAYLLYALGLERSRPYASAQDAQRVRLDFAELGLIDPEGFEIGHGVRADRPRKAAGNFRGTTNPFRSDTGRWLAPF